MELFGIIPPMTTPFDSAGEIDEAAVRAQVRWLLDRGVHGIAAGGSTGEGHTLDPDELKRLVATVVDEAAGRVPVIAGVIVDSTRDAVRRGRALADLGVAALQVTPVHYLFRPDDDAMLAHFRAICEATGQKVIIYNVVPWSYLAPDLLLRIMREVPGVIGVKQSAGDLKLVADLLVTAGANRVLATTLHSPQVHGFFSVPVDHLHALNELAQHFRHYDLSDAVVVSPDLGNAKEAAAFARRLKTGVAAAAKQRYSDDEVRISTIIGDVADSDTARLAGLDDNELLHSRREFVPWGSGMYTVHHADDPCFDEAPELSLDRFRQLRERREHVLSPLKLEAQGRP